ncbi:MAG: HAMP domain-containing protein [Chloroflexi bacterium]|nr:HAMP domain-containing protein [Chloroflexota bacterium]
MTLKTRLAFGFASLLALTITLLSAAVVGLMWWSMVRDVDSRLVDTADLINADTRFAVLPLMQSRYHVQLPELDFVRASGTEVQVWVKENGTYTPVDSSANLEDWPNALDPSALGRVDEHTFSTVNINGTWWRVHTSPIWFGSDAIGSIQVAHSLEIMNSATSSLLLVVLICALIALAGSMILSRWLARRLIEPVQELTTAAARIVGASDLSTRLTWNGPNDELGRLISVFNKMMERLQHVFSVQQRFVADISHELRTPLTGILLNVDLMKKIGADEESLTAIYTDTERMSRLVNDLLMLARADYGGVSVHMTPLDADEVVSDAVRAARPLAEAKGIKLSVVHIEPLRIYGDVQQLQQLMGNLISNAIKFTPEGGTVSLNIQRVDRMARIEITDTGIGISPEQQERIFDRFYQVDPSRTQDGTGGFGLGLSVSRWIAESHNGAIEVRSQPGQGSTFTVSLPLVDAEVDASHPSRQTTHQKLPRVRMPEYPSSR